MWQFTEDAVRRWGPGEQVAVKLVVLTGPLPGMTLNSSTESYVNFVLSHTEKKVLNQQVDKLQDLDTKKRGEEGSNGDDRRVRVQLGGGKTLRAVAADARWRCRLMLDTKYVNKASVSGKPARCSTLSMMCTSFQRCCAVAKASLFSMDLL